MVSSCGKTVMHKEPYVSHFEDQYRNVQEKHLPQPTIAHMLYKFLPLRDEHNKAWQNSIALKNSWLTKNCWTLIITTFLGIAVVDVQRWDHRRCYGHVEAFGFDEHNEEVVDDFDIKTMVNLIGKPLMDGRFKYRRGEQLSNIITTTAESKCKTNCSYYWARWEH